MIDKLGWLRQRPPWSLRGGQNSRAPRGTPTAAKATPCFLLFHSSILTLQKSRRQNENAAIATITISKATEVPMM